MSAEATERIPPRRRGSGARTVSEGGFVALSPGRRLPDLVSRVAEVTNAARCTSAGPPRYTASRSVNSHGDREGKTVNRALQRRWNEIGQKTWQKWLATSAQCAATKANGKRCLNRVESDGEMCWAHRRDEVAPDLSTPP